jgi:hypothetical protein
MSRYVRRLSNAPVSCVSSKHLFFFFRQMYIIPLNVTLRAQALKRTCQLCKQQASLFLFPSNLYIPLNVTRCAQALRRTCEPYKWQASLFTSMYIIPLNVTPLTEALRRTCELYKQQASLFPSVPQRQAHAASPPQQPTHTRKQISVGVSHKSTHTRK